MSVSWAQFGDAVINNAKTKRIPIVAQFELTSRCNLSCKMCYVCNKSNVNEVIKKEKTAKEWIELARQVRDAGVLYLLLTGGEVFIRDDFKEIYEAVSEMGFNVQLYTNGTLITPEIAHWLGKRPPSKVSITLYGASRDTYKIITGSASAFEKAINGIDLLLKEKIMVTVRTTTIKENKNDAKKIFDICNSRGLVFGVSQYISPRREGDNIDIPITERLSPKEIIEYNREIWEYINSVDNKKQDNKQKPTIQDNLVPSDDDISSIVEKADLIHRNSAFSCSAGHSSFWVTWNGCMTPCGMMGEPSVDVFSKEFKLAWDELKKECDKICKITLCETCDDKSFCIKCPAKIKTETGTYTQCPDYLRQLAQQYRFAHTNKL